MEAGERDGTLAFSKTAERLNTFRFSQTALGNLTVVFYHRKDVPFEWTELKDLEGYRIGGMQGYAATDELENLNAEGVHLTLGYATTEQLNFKKLLAKRIDVFPGAFEVATRVLRENFSERSSL